MRLLIRLLTLLLVLSLKSCSSSRQNLVIHTLPNYDSKAAHQILFMDFTINLAKPGKPEQVLLANAIVGRGELKNNSPRGHSPCQIKFIQYYNNGHQPDQTSLEHPLFQSVEVVDRDGTLRRTLTHESKGHFSVRFSFTNVLSKIELYTLTPYKDARKIYTLLIKP